MLAKVTFQLYIFLKSKNYLVKGICRKNKKNYSSIFKNNNFLNLDLEKFDLIENTINKYRPDFIINCAGTTDLNGASTL